MDFWSVIGIIAASLTMFSFVPQIIKVMRTKSARDVSVITLVQLACGVALWIAYGIHIRDAIVITANIVTLASMIVLLCLYRAYSRPARSGAAAVFPADEAGPLTRRYQ